MYLDVYNLNDFYILPPDPGSLSKLEKEMSIILQSSHRLISRNVI